jgi:hypothetical protein
MISISVAVALNCCLVFSLQGYRNTVPVPRHWSQKRQYLQGKRGIEKPAFKLPDFIEATGIGEMRQAYLEKAESQKMKQKGRERMQPKMGKLDIDYQVLHDAFFKYQTKPKLTQLGDLYYEGKEFEASMKHARPGECSITSHTCRGTLGESPPLPPPTPKNITTAEYVCCCSPLLQACSPRNFVRRWACMTPLLLPGSSICSAMAHRPPTLLSRSLASTPPSRLMRRWGQL